VPVYEFRFPERVALGRAFSYVVSCACVEDCLVDAGGLSLRFQVTRGADAHHLLDQIKLDGGVAASAEEPAETKSTPSSG
jgi:hypothetical protein